MTILQHASLTDSDQTYIKLARQVHTYLGHQRDLSPDNNGVNYLLSRFVTATLNGSDLRYQSVLDSPEVQKIRPSLLEMLSGAEYEMEVHWGDHFANKGAMQPEDLDEFWYRDCYANLIAEEISALKKVDVEPNHEHSIVFIGSGPLPMTAIDMHLQTGAKIVCVDNDEKAVTVSRQMIDNLGLSDVIEVYHSSGEDFDYGGNDIVFVASLISQKEGVVERIRETAPKAIVGVRSVEGIRAMLYEPVQENAFTSNGLKFAVKTQDEHNGTTVNTTNIYFADQLPSAKCGMCRNDCLSNRMLDVLRGGKPLSADAVVAIAKADIGGM